MREEFRRALEGIEGWIFDIDNIVVDSECYHYQAYNEAFKRFGFEVDEEEYYRIFTSKGEGAAGYAERHALDVDPREVVRIKQSLFSAYCRSGKIRPYGDTIALVGKLRKRGKKYCIASNSRKSDIEPILSFHGLRDLFPLVLGLEDIKRRKPDSEIFLLAVRVMGLDPSRALVIEDAEKGLIAARKAHIKCAIVKTRYTEGIAFDGADFIFESAGDLLNEVAEYEREK